MNDAYDTRLFSLAEIEAVTVVVGDVKHNIERSSHLLPLSLDMTCCLISRASPTPPPRVRGGAGARYYIFDWLGFGIELGLTLGHGYFDSTYRGSHSYTVGDVAVGVEAQFR